MTPTDTLAKELVEELRGIIYAKHVEASEPGNRHIWSADCPACHWRERAEKALARYDSATKDQQDER